MLPSKWRNSTLLWSCICSIYHTNISRYKYHSDLSTSCLAICFLEASSFLLCSTTLTCFMSLECITEIHCFFISGLAIVVSFCFENEERLSFCFNEAECSTFLNDGRIDSEDAEDVFEARAFSLIDDEASRADAAAEDEVKDLSCCSFLAKYDPTCISSTSYSSFRVNFPILFLKFNYLKKNNIRFFLREGLSTHVNILEYWSEDLNKYIKNMQIKFIHKYTRIRINNIQLASIFIIYYNIYVWYEISIKVRKTASSKVQKKHTVFVAVFFSSSLSCSGGEWNVTNDKP